MKNIYIVRERRSWIMKVLGAFERRKDAVLYIKSIKKENEWLNDYQIEKVPFFGKEI